MKNKYFDEDHVMAHFLSCKMDDPDGIYADDVDLREFADNIILALEKKIRSIERLRCIDFVNTLDEKVGFALSEFKG